MSRTASNPKWRPDIDLDEEATTTATMRRCPVCLMNQPVDDKTGLFMWHVGRYADTGCVSSDKEWKDPVDAAIETERARRAARRFVDAEERPDVEPVKGRTLLERLAVPRRLKEWRIEGWLQVGHRALVAAQYKAGKTTLVANLLRVLVDDGLFLDRFEVSPIAGKVGLLDFEMAEEDRCQLDDWYEDSGIKSTDRVVVYPMRGRAAAFDLTDPEVLEEWVSKLKADGVEFLVLDCLRPVLDALGLDEKTEAGQFLVRFDELVVRASCREALVIHHMGHVKAGAGNERARGDSRLQDWPDVGWKLVRDDVDDPASRRFVSAFGRGVEMPETLLDFNPKTLRLAAVDGSRKENKRRDGDQALRLKVLAAVRETDMTTIASVVGAAHVGSAPGRAAVDWLTGRKLLVKGKKTDPFRITILGTRWLDSGGSFDPDLPQQGKIDAD